MAAYHKPSLHLDSKKKVSVSYIIRDESEPYHRAGVNSLQYDSNSNRLYSAGRDSVIRIWRFPGCDNNNRNNNEIDSNIHDHNQQSQVHHQHLDNLDQGPDHYVQSMEHHTDWVNDIALCKNGRNLISVSNDQTIKVWNAHLGYCLSTLRSHKDYAKCLAYAKDREIVASAGFDRIIYLWDIQALTSLTATKNTVTTKPLDGSKCSIYSLAINQSGTLVASGSTEKVIRLWDPRSRQKLLKLRGHSDNVRSLLFSRDGSLLLSASSDSTVRLWSIPQQRCVSVIRVHDEGVWSLQTDESFNYVYSGGKDCKVFKTDLKNTSDTSLVCRESAPILKMLLVDETYSHGSSPPSCNKSSLWVSTTDSCIKNWPLNNQELNCNSHLIEENSDEGLESNEKPLFSKPELILKGNPAVINYHILNDKRHIITRESDNSVNLYDVLTAERVEIILSPGATPTDAKITYEEEIQRRFKMVYVPNWFTVDLKTGFLCIRLEESECLLAWVSAKDYGFIDASESADPKVNLGCLTLQALFEHWAPTYGAIKSSDGRNIQAEVTNTNSASPDHSNQLAQSQVCKIQSIGDGHSEPAMVGGNQYFSIPEHIPIIISEGRQTLLRYLAYEAANQNDGSILLEIIPPWIYDVVVSRCQPKFTKISFFLLPHSNSGIKSLRKERLSASGMLQMRKVVEHVCEYMLSAVNEENGTGPTMGSSSSRQDQSDQQQNSVVANNINATRVPNREFTRSSFPPDKVELYCNDKKLDAHLDLRTVKHLIWKSGCDLILHYMPIN